MSEISPPRIELSPINAPASESDGVLAATVLQSLIKLGPAHDAKVGTNPAYNTTPEGRVSNNACTAFNAFNMCAKPYRSGDRLLAIDLVAPKSEGHEKQGDDRLNRPLLLTLDETTGTATWANARTSDTWTIVRIDSPNKDGRVNCVIDNGTGKRGAQKLISLDPSEVQAALIRSASTPDFASNPIKGTLAPNQKVLYEARHHMQNGAQDTEVTLTNGARKKAKDIIADKALLVEAAKESGIVTGEAIHAKIDVYLAAEYRKLGIEHLAVPTPPGPPPVNPDDGSAAWKITPLGQNEQKLKDTYDKEKAQYDTNQQKYNAEKAAYDADQKKIADMRTNNEYTRLQQIDSLKQYIPKDGIPTGDQLGTLTHLIKLPNIRASLAELKSHKQELMSNIQALTQGPQRDKLQKQLNALVDQEAVQNELINSDKKRMSEHFDRLQRGLLSPSDTTAMALAEMFTPGGHILALTTKIDESDMKAISEKLNPEDTSYWSFLTKFINQHPEKVKMVSAFAFFLLNMIYQASLKARAH